ncbi:Protein disulfide isomerase [Paramicrosporidium saccamoebae]|uniref:Protein disulfide isomerase n=1 Tax=Paramicrosporidium saccamoebae TaxID=1246581 RepID=A0A2H9TQZ7_9FUNG|nr:Protein disulfide isomerase [Paramicrosporidium saccamoebae]
MRLSSYVIVFATFLISILGAIAELPQSDRATFPNFLSGFTLVEFYSPNCRHCKLFSKTVLRLLKYIASHESDFMGLAVEQYNCKGGPYCKKLGLKSLPSLYLYRDTEKVGELRGNVALKKVVDWLRALVSAYSTGAITDPIVVEDPAVDEDVPDAEEDRPESEITRPTPTTTAVASSTPLPSN